MPNYEDRRSEKRRRVFLRAKATGVGGTAAIDCTIHDVSRSGCKLKSREIGSLEDDLCLAISGFAEPVRGQLVWRNGEFAGVKFIRDNADFAA